MVLPETNKCSTCPETFKTAQETLAHELTHVRLTQPTNNDKNSKQKKRKRNKLIDVETTEEKELKKLVIDALSSCAEGNELIILSHIYQPNNLQYVYERVFFHLQKALSRRGRWIILPFGSTVMGLAFKSSDIDYYAYPANIGNSDLNILNVLKKCLRSSNFFTEIFPISRARVPIVKCTHISSRYKLDINPSSINGVYCSQAFANILKLDNRLRPLILIIKIWAHTWKITKEYRMPSYCLLLIVFFYLQNCEPIIIPPFKDLQNNSEKMIIDGINFTLAFNLPNLNKQNLKQLLEGFFKFYKDFDFSDNIISLYYGKAIERRNFTSDNFPEYAKYLENVNEATKDNAKKNIFYTSKLHLNKPLVVQDPFVVNQNKANLVNENVFKLFKRQVTHAAHICTERQTFAMLLKRVLYENPPQEETSVVKNIPNNNDQLRKIQLKSICGMQLICKFNAIEAELLYVRQYLREKFPNQCFNKIEINKFWAEKIVEFTAELFTKIFKIEMSSLRTETTNKTSKKFGQLDVYHNKYSINCELKTTIDLVCGRKIDKKKDYSLFLIEQMKLTEQLQLERQNAKIIFNCKLTLKAVEDFSAVIITMENLSEETTKKNRFKALFTELTGRMRVFFKIYFERLLKEYTSE